MVPDEVMTVAPAVLVSMPPRRFAVSAPVKSTVMLPLVELASKALRFATIVPSRVASMSPVLAPRLTPLPPVPIVLLMELPPRLRERDAGGRDDAHAGPFVRDDVAGDGRLGAALAVHQAQRGCRFRC